MALNIIVCGLGGQGILFVTRILGRFALDSGHDMIGAETHGMAQRGGAVTSHLRLGPVRGSMVRRGTAQILISLDEYEAYRNMDFLAEGGEVYVNGREDAFPVEKASAYFAAGSVTCRVVPARETAMEAGMPKSANLVLLGFFAAFERTPFTLEGLRNAVSAVSPRRFEQENLKMFDEGARRAFKKGS